MTLRTRLALVAGGLALVAALAAALEQAVVLDLHPGGYGTSVRLFAEGTTVVELRPLQSEGTLPYILPGPLDRWAGATEHAIHIWLGTQPARELTVELEAAETHEVAPPRLRVALDDANGRTVQTRPGTGLPPPHDTRGVRSGYRVRLSVPASDEAATPRLTITNTAGSWVMWEHIRVVLVPRSRSFFGGVMSRRLPPRVSLLALLAAIGTVLAGSWVARIERARFHDPTTWACALVLVALGCAYQLPERMAPLATLPRWVWLGLPWMCLVAQWLVPRARRTRLVGRLLAHVYPSESELSGTLALGLVAVLPAAGALGSFFVQDDFGYLDWSPKASVLSILDPTSGSFFYRPFTALFFRSLFPLFGLNPLPYKIAVLGLHALNGFLVRMLATALTRDGALAWTVAIVYVVHPAHFMSLFWLSAVHDVAMVTCLLASFTQYCRSSSGRFASIAAVGWFGLALGTKEAAVVYPAILLTYEALRMSRRWGTRPHQLAAVVWRILPFGSLDVLYFAVRFHSLNGVLVPRAGPYRIEFFGWHIAENVWSYLSWTVDWTMAFWATYPLSWSLGVAGDWLLTPMPWFLVTAIVIGWQERPSAERPPWRFPVVIFGVIWYALGLVPVVFLTNHAEPYYLSVSVVGAALVLGAAITRSAAATAHEGAAARALLCVYTLLCGLTFVVSQRPDALEHSSGSNTPATLMTRARASREILADLAKMPSLFPRGACILLSGAPQFVEANGQAALRVVYRDDTLRLYDSKPPPGECRAATTWSFRYEEGHVVRSTPERGAVSSARDDR